MNHPPRKKFWLGLFLVFLVGLVGGAYLTLRSSVTKGELTRSTPLSQGKSSDELLAELLKLNQQEEAAKENIPPEDKNLTEEFLQKTIAEAGLSQTSAREIESSDFLVGTVLPYFRTNLPTLFPFIPDSVLKIVPDSKAASQKYPRDTNKYVGTFFNNLKKVTELDEDKVANPDTLADLESGLMELADAFEALSRMDVPKSKLELHKNILVSIFSLQKVMEAVVKGEDDPLKSLLIINQAGPLGEFWQETLYDYAGTPEGKRAK